MIYLVIALSFIIIILGIDNAKLIKQRNEYRSAYEWTTKKYSEYVENTMEYLETLSPKDIE